jgi:hypothetical protein
MQKRANGFTDFRVVEPEVVRIGVLRRRLADRTSQCVRNVFLPILKGF